MSAGTDYIAEHGATDAACRTCGEWRDEYNLTAAADEGTEHVHCARCDGAMMADMSACAWCGDRAPWAADPMPGTFAAWLGTWKPSPRARNPQTGGPASITGRDRLRRAVTTPAGRPLPGRGPAECPATWSIIGGEPAARRFGSHFARSMQAGRELTRTVGQTDACDYCPGTAERHRPGCPVPGQMAAADELIRLAGVTA